MARRRGFTGSGRRRGLHCLLGALCGLASLPASAALSAAAAPRELSPYSEYEVKAAFIYNFAKFVDWPEESFRRSGGDMEVCVLGEDPFGGILDRTLQDKEVHGKPLRVSRFPSISDLRPCPVLFISSSESGHLPEILESLWGVPVLTIGEVSRFNRSGGIVNFVIEQNRVRFEINAGAAERARLKISSKLLSLAREVTDGSRKEPD